MADQYGWGAPPPGYGPPAHPSRPFPVTLAGLIMLIGVAFGLINGIAVFAAATSIADDFQRQAVRTGAPMSTVNDIATVLRATLLINGAVAIILAIVVGLLATFVLRGSNGARIGTWVLIGLAVCCGGCGSILTFRVLGAELSLDVESVNPETARQLGAALTEALPTWLAVTNGGLGGLQALGYLAVVILLALPASNAYFRRAPLPSEPSAPAGSPWQPPAVPPEDEPTAGGEPEPPQPPRTPQG